jgi:16S rRNA (cytidine1402-2'-O)-methyltransferase
MSLSVIATPIGNPEDFAERGRRLLAAADVVIGEEYKVASKLLKSIGIIDKPIETLNEHSRAGDIQELAELCKNSNVVLISDCGTPGFCDPGADLVALCRKMGVAIHAVAGPSSLTAFLSVAGRRLDQFLFLGFLPANREQRDVALSRIERERQAVILMDTPYRLGRLMTELRGRVGARRAVLGMELTKPEELVVEGTVEEVCVRVGDRTAEFVLLLESLGGDQPRGKVRRRTR